MGSFVQAPGVLQFTSVQVDTGHKDMIHDIRMDFSGTKLATASADNSIRIFSADMNSGTPCCFSLMAELHGHEGPVWQVSWAHPKYGSILASCSYDRKVIIWKEIERLETGKITPLLLSGGWNKSLSDNSNSNQIHNKWEKYLIFDGHTSSVNSLEWAPPENGLILGCASSDSGITVLSMLEHENRWIATRIESAHPLGCNSLSWCPSGYKTIFSRNKRFATGGNDNTVKIWREDDGAWCEETTLFGHSDWVRCVVWSPNMDKIASASAEGLVIIWNNKFGSNQWLPEIVHVFNDTVWNISWSLSGDMIAVSVGENAITLWKKTGRGKEKWECVSASKDSKNSSDKS